MASSLTYQGEEYALIGDGASDGSIARLATAVRLYDSTSSPSKTGTEGVEFVEVANGNGYTTGGRAVPARPGGSSLDCQRRQHREHRGCLRRRHVRQRPALVRAVQPGDSGRWREHHAGRSDRPLPLT